MTQLDMEAFFLAAVMAAGALSHTDGSSLFSSAQADTKQMHSALQCRAGWNPATPCLAFQLEQLLS